MIVFMCMLICKPPFIRYKITNKVWNCGLDTGHANAVRMSKLCMLISNLNQNIPINSEVKGQGHYHGNFCYAHLYNEIRFSKRLWCEYTVCSSMIACRFSL